METFIQQNTFTVIGVKSVLYQSIKHGVEDNYKVREF